MGAERATGEGAAVGAGAWRRVWARHRGKLVGATTGFLVAMAIMAFGLWWTLFIALAVAVGYTIGQYVDGDSDGVLAWLDRLLPPGRR